MDFAFTLPSNIIQFGFPLLPMASGCTFIFANMRVIVVNPRFKAKVAWPGRDPLFNHKLPTVSLRVGSSTLVTVAEGSLCEWVV